MRERVFIQSSMSLQAKNPIDLKSEKPITRDELSRLTENLLSADVWKEAEVPEKNPKRKKTASPVPAMLEVSGEVPMEFEGKGAAKQGKTRGVRAEDIQRKLAWEESEESRIEKYRKYVRSVNLERVQLC